MNARVAAGIVVGVVLLALMAYGVYAYRVPAEPRHELALLPWGATVVGYIFFAILSGGITDSALLHAYIARSPEARKTLRKSLFGALAVLIPGIVLVFCDILHPENAAWFYLGFNPASRIAWNAVLYLLYGGFLALLLLALIRRGEDALDQPLLKLLALLTVATSINLEMNLGMAYGVNIGAPAWYGAYAGILFVIAAFLMGSAWEVVVGHERSGLGEEEKEAHAREYAWEHLFAVVSFALVVFWNMLARLNWGKAVLYTTLSVAGPLAPFFWTSVLLAIVVPAAAASLYLWGRGRLELLKAGMALSIVGVAVYMLVPFNFGGQAARLEEDLMYRLLATHSIGYYDAAELLGHYLASPELVAFIGAFGLWLLIEIIGLRILALEPGEKPRRLIVLR